MRSFEEYFVWVWERWDTGLYSTSKPNPTFSEHFHDLIPGGILNHIQVHYTKDPVLLQPYRFVWLVSLLWEDFRNSLDRSNWSRLPSYHLTTDWMRHEFEH